MRRLEPAAITGVMSREVANFRTFWKATTFSSVLEPIIYLLAFGVGLGSTIVDRVDGLDYVEFVGTGMVATAVIFSSALPAMFGTFVKHRFQNTYDAILAAPVDVEELVTAEMLWIGIRSGFYGCFPLLVAMAFGLDPAPGMLLVPLFCLVTALGFAAFGIAVAGTVNKIDQFSYVTTLFITPLFLVAGTFFPIDQLPEGFQVAAQFNPLHQLVELVRHASFGFEATDLIRFAVLIALRRRPVASGGAAHDRPPDRLMPTWDDVVAIGLRFPGVETGTSYGTPALKVRGKGMCRLRTDPDALVVRVVDLMDRRSPDPGPARGVLLHAALRRLSLCPGATERREAGRARRAARGCLAHQSTQAHGRRVRRLDRLTAAGQERLRLGAPHDPCQSALGIGHDREHQAAFVEPFHERAELLVRPDRRRPRLHHRLGRGARVALLERRRTQAAEQAPALGDHEREAVRRLLHALVHLPDAVREAAGDGVVPHHVPGRRASASSPSVGSPRASQSCLPAT